MQNKYYNLKPDSFLTVLKLEQFFRDKIVALFQEIRIWFMELHATISCNSNGFIFHKYVQRLENIKNLLKIPFCVTFLLIIISWFAM